jgi:hypothetical protein
VELTVDGEPDGLLLLRGGVGLHVRRRLLRGLRHGEGRRRRAGLRCGREEVTVATLGNVGWVGWGSDDVYGPDGIDFGPGLMDCSFGTLLDFPSLASCKTSQFCTQNACILSGQVDVYKVVE